MPSRCVALQFTIDSTEVGLMASTEASADMERRRSIAIALNRGVYAFSRNWLIWFVLLSGIWVGLPWLAPIFMRLGWEEAGRAIYSFYSLQCHQLPQRSFFLFGSRPMYSLEEISLAWKDTLDPIILRGFIGNSSMGYKVAWSDRMVSAYGGIPLAGMIWGLLRKRPLPLPLWGLILFAAPMAIDGGTHFLSDLAGIGAGFRYSNAWLAALTSHALPRTFYVGNALGSFNSWMRLVTGALFGVAVVWFTFPYLSYAFSDTAQAIEAKFARAGVEL